MTATVLVAAAATGCQGDGTTDGASGTSSEADDLRLSVVEATTCADFPDQAAMSRAIGRSVVNIDAGTGSDPVARSCDYETATGSDGVLVRAYGQAAEPREETVALEGLGSRSVESATGTSGHGEIIVYAENAEVMITAMSAQVSGDQLRDAARLVVAALAES